MRTKATAKIPSTENGNVTTGLWMNTVVQLLPVQSVSCTTPNWPLPACKLQSVIVGFIRSKNCDAANDPLTDCRP